MKKLLVLFIILSVVCDIVAQTNSLYLGIQQAKEADIDFETVSGFQINNTSVVPSGVFSNTNNVTVLSFDPAELNNTTSQALNLVIPMNNNQSITLELMRVPDEYFNYTVVTSDGNMFSATPDIKHYRGVITGDTSSLVAISIWNDEIMGLVATNNGNYNLVKETQSGNYLFYNEMALSTTLNFDCGTKDTAFTEYDANVLLQPRNIVAQNLLLSPQATSSGNIVHLYFETEEDIYQQRNHSVQAVEAFVTGLFNQVATLYSNENITVVMSELFIWTNTDPYNANDTEPLLSEFQNHNSLFGDLGMLLTFRNIGGGLAAGFNGLSSSFTNDKLAVAMIENSYSSVPDYSHSVYVITHEFGHLFGSRHTHACVWNGDNTAIDGCAGCTEPADLAIDDCGSTYCSVPAMPTEKGTIMSYCHKEGRPGIDLSLGFGDQPGNLIRDKVWSASGLHSLCEPLHLGNFNQYTIESNNTAVVTHCGNVDIKNVTVWNYATLNVTVKAYNEIRLLPGFYAKEGSTVHLKILSPSGNGPSLVNAYYNFSENTEETEDTYNKDVSVSNKKTLAIYPNPATDLLFVEFGKQAEKMEIFTASGVKVAERKMTGNFEKINVKDYPAGVYLLKVYYKDTGTEMQKFVKNN